MVVMVDTIKAVVHRITAFLVFENARLENTRLEHLKLVKMTTPHMTMHYCFRLGNFVNWIWCPEEDSNLHVVKH